MRASLSICIAFFSPCDYALPKRHLTQTLNWATQEKAEVLLAQVVLPGQSPQPVSSKIKSLVYRSVDVMFYKENLWNLAARRASGDKLLFIDSDVQFVCSDLAGATSALLERCDICQPFSLATWLSRDGKPARSRKSAALALACGFEPLTRFYHPGFAWAMTRSTFDRLGGFYDHNVVGSGDIAFVYALDKRWQHINLHSRAPNDVHVSTTPRYRAYRDHAVSLNLHVGYLADVECRHLWHGYLAGRQYMHRGKYCPVARGEDFPLAYRDDGLLMWTKSEQSAQLKTYFLSRHEDG